MTRQEELFENYEDALFKIFMDQVAQAEGQEALKETERLLADSQAEVPEALNQRVYETIRRQFRWQKKASVYRSVRKGLKIAVIAAILLAVTISMVFATSPATRAKVVNTVLNIYETHTDVAFVSDHLPAEGLEILAVWLPEGFTLEQKGAIDTCTWEDYVGSRGERVSIEKSRPVSATIDSEDAEISSVFVQGFAATLIEKGEYVHVFWLNTEKELVYYVDGEGVSTELILEIAESFV